MGPDHGRREQCARPIGRGGVEPELPRVDDDGAAEDQKARGHPDGSFGRRGDAARDAYSPPTVNERSGEEGLLEWIDANGASKFKDAILDVAGDLDDLKHITEQDFEDLVKGMPKLKARRLRASLVELGARLA